MKQLELQLQKRLLIVEAISKGIADAWVFNNYGLKTMMNSVCKGSGFTEEKARLYLDPTNRIYSPKGWEIWFKDFTDDTKHKTSALESFISAIEASGYCWLNPNENLFAVIEYSVGDWGDKGNQVGYIQAKNEQEAKIKYQKLHNKTDYDINFFGFNDTNWKTFNPEKTFIFEILL